MKRKTRKVLLGAATVAAVGLAGVQANNANAANTDVDITAQIIQPLAITATQTMEFGKMSVAAGTTGTVTISGAADTRSAGGGGGVSLVGGTAAQRGGFKFNQGAINTPIVVTAANTAALTFGGGNTMNVTGFKWGGTAISGGGSKTVSYASFPQANNYIGGTLTVAAGQAVGSYTGTVTITANYQ